MREPYKKRPWTCSIEGCEDAGYARNWCKKHYTNWMRYGVPIRPDKVRPECSFDGCNRFVVGKQNICMTHYMQRWKGQELRPIRPRIIVSSTGLIQCKDCEKWKPKTDFHVKTNGYLVSRRCKHCYNEHNKILQAIRKKKLIAA